MKFPLANPKFKDRVLYRVTRLGEYSPLERLFTLGSFSKITKVARILEYFFSGKKVTDEIGQKSYWLRRYWSIFSKTHPVILVLQRL
jgi:hypothetical protein